MNRLLIQSGTPLSSLLRDCCRTAELQPSSAKLHIAQSAISQQIKTLEEELEVKLFLRNKRSVKLTAAGHAFLREAKDILNRVEHSRLQARRAARGETGTLSIGCFGGALSHFLPELIHTYRRRYPAVRVHVYERSLGEQLDALEVGRIDIGFTTPLGKKDLKRFVQEPVFCGCVLAALPDGHSLAEFQKISLEKLADEDWVLLRRSVAPEIVDALMLPCAKAGFSPRVISEPDGLQTVLAMVAAGVGVSIVPSCVRSLEQPGVTFIPIQPNPPPIGMVAAYPKGEPSPAVAAFLDMLRQQLPQIRSKYVDTYKTLSFVAGAARL